MAANIKSIYLTALFLFLQQKNTRLRKIIIRTMAAMTTRMTMMTTAIMAPLPLSASNAANLAASSSAAFLAAASATIFAYFSASASARILSAFSLARRSSSTYASSATRSSSAILSSSACSASAASLRTCTCSVRYSVRHSGLYLTKPRTESV